MMRLERDLHLADLISTLKSDHKEIRRQLWILRMLISRGDDEVTNDRAAELFTFLGSHFLREESNLRDILPCRGEKQEDGLWKLIQKHKVMGEAFQEIPQITRLLRGEAKLSAFYDFERTLLEYLKEEEEEDLFPFMTDAIEDQNLLRRVEKEDSRLFEENKHLTTTKIGANMERRQRRKKGKGQRGDELVFA